MAGKELLGRVMCSSSWLTFSSSKSCLSPSPVLSWSQLMECKVSNPSTQERAVFLTRKGVVFLLQV